MRLVATGIVQPRRIVVPELKIDRGECVVLCGPNGSGKSSLLRILAGVDSPQKGTVRLEGEASDRSLKSMHPLSRAAHVAWLPQRSSISGAFTVEGLVACARYRFFESQAVAEQHAVRLLNEHHLGHLCGRLSSEISGGELQRVLIVSLVAQEAAVLMLDEPANHLDPKHQIGTYQTLGRLWQGGKSVIIVSHDVRLAQLLGPPDRVRIVGIKDGAIRFSRALSSPELHDALERLYETPFVSPQHRGSLAIDLQSQLSTTEAESP